MESEYYYYLVIRGDLEYYEVPKRHKRYVSNKLIEEGLVEMLEVRDSANVDYRY